MRFLKKYIFNIIFIFIILLVFYYCFIAGNLVNEKSSSYNERQKNFNILSAINRENRDKFINIWCIFTKVIENAPLQVKFERLMKSLFNFTSVPLHIHIISDISSENIARKIINDTKSISKHEIIYSFYNFTKCAEQINDIVESLMPHFSSQPGTYYSDALFYLSLGLHRIADQKQNAAIMVDCDVQFTNDVVLLFRQFNKFEASNLFGLSYELTPVYRHVLYSYRTLHNTSFGDFLHKTPIISKGNHIYGFPGFNSGVMLFNLSAIRESKMYPNLITKDNVKKLVKKYRFRGHLGDQDFYTLLGYEYPELFKILPCNFNRQLCVWWRDHGYSDVFSNYSKCEGEIIIYHGNCNTPIPV